MMPAVKTEKAMEMKVSSCSLKAAAAWEKAMTTEKISAMVASEMMMVMMMMMMMMSETEASSRAGMAPVMP